MLVSFFLTAYILSVLLGAREQSWVIIQHMHFIPAFLSYKELFFHCAFFLIMEPFIKEA